MEFEKVLTESFKRYKLVYKGTRDNYEINDPNPYVLSIDDDYNVDGKGKSILGINLNYHGGDIDELIDEINKADNEAGFKSFELRSFLKKSLAKDKDSADNWITNKKKKRYNNLKGEFPNILKNVRRYKLKGPKSSGVQNKKRVVKK